MGLFVTRFLCSLLIFVLGLKAPGIMAPYNPHQRLENDSSSESQGNVRTGSAFRNGWRKLRTVFPYLWPRKNLALQMAVIVCILLLLAGRVIKLFLPIYRKKLGRSGFCGGIKLSNSLLISCLYSGQSHHCADPLPLGLCAGLRWVVLPPGRRHWRHGSVQ